MALAAVARADQEARHRPDRVVRLVLVSSLPGNLVDAQQAVVRGPRLDGAPADGLAVEVRDESARDVGLGVPAVRLPTEPERSFLGREPRERLLRLQLVPLAPARRSGAPRSEDRLEVLPARLVRGDDGEIGHPGDARRRSRGTPADSCGCAASRRHATRRTVPRAVPRPADLQGRAPTIRISEASARTARRSG